MTNDTDTDPYPEVGYDQAMRPQFHFTSKKNWINDPNGLVYHEGEYHLFFQHNPSGWAWGNMTWGHAVSPDLLHWQQLPHALLPDALGTIYSGSAVVDHADTAGFADGDRKALVAVFTYAGDHADPKQPYTQAIAYSTDRGRTFTKYPDNPVVGNISGKSDRDPKVFWYTPPGSLTGGWWVMVLFLDARKSLGILTSPDLKTWKQESEIEGFHECPELFQLPVDGNPDDRRWVLYGADYEYYIGSFDGRTFTPGHASKHKYQFGVGYASQIWNDDPRGRHVQIGWGRVEMKDMPFNQMMLFPVELSLRTTEDGVRLFAEPVDELETLRQETQAEASDVTITPGRPLAVKTAGDLFEVRLDLAPGDAGKIHLCFNEMVLTYDAEAQTLDGAPLKPEGGQVRIQALIDRPCVEVFGNGGRIMTGRALPRVGEVNEMIVRAEGGDARVVSMTVTRLKPFLAAKLVHPPGKPVGVNEI